MASISAAEVLTARTGQARLRYRARKLMDTLLVTASVVAVALGLAAVVDNFLMLDHRTLLGIAAAIAAVGIAVLVGRLLLTVLRRPSDDFLAVRWQRQAEGVPKDLLINAVQLQRQGHPDSPQILQALVDRAASATAGLRASQVVDGRSTARWLKVAGVVVVAMAFYAAAFSPWFFNGMTRLVAFWDETPHLRQVQISVADPGTVNEGDEAALDIAIDGHYGYVPAVAQLHYKLGEKDWETVDVPAGGTPGRFRHSFGPTGEPIQYYVRSGHNRTPNRHIGIRYRPRLESVRLRYHYPAYTQMEPMDDLSDRRDIVALTGTRVDIEIQATKPLQLARIETSDQQNVSMRWTNDEHTRAIGTIVVGMLSEGRQKGKYRIHMTDTDNLQHPDPTPEHNIIAQRDQAPTIKFVKPGQDLVLPAGSDPIALVMQAEDRFGVAKIELQMKTNKAADFKTVDTWTSGPRRGESNVRFPYKWDLGKLREGDVVTYRAWVWDHNDVTGPGKSRTPDYELKMLSRRQTDRKIHEQIFSDLQELSAILELQRRNKAALLAGGAKVRLLPRQEEIHRRTGGVLDRMKHSMQPSKTILAGLGELVADAGPMKQVIGLLEQYQVGAKGQQAIASGYMKQIIDRLTKLIALLRHRMQLRRKAEETLNNMSKADKARALERLKEQMGILKRFLKDQEGIIKRTKALHRKPKDWTEQEKTELAKIAEEEDMWGDRLVDNVDAMQKLAAQDFSDATILSEYKEIIENVEQATEKLERKVVEMAVPLEQSAFALATKILEDMEMWFPDAPDNLKWKMEEPLEQPEIPQAELPEKLQDLIGDLIESQDQLNDEAEDISSGWAGSFDSVGWGVMDGPISSYAAQGKTGNQLPDSSEMGGRSGDGRSGRSSGQLVENVAKGLEGRRTPTRLSNDDYEKGVVEELKQLATGGSTGGGKKSGGGEEGLQGVFPPPMERDMERLRKLQKGIREKSQRILKDLKGVMVQAQDLEAAVDIMKQIERELDRRDYRYVDLARKQKQVLRHLERTAGTSAKDMILRRQDPSLMSRQFRREMLDAMDEAYPKQYEKALANYYKTLSESQR